MINQYMGGYAIYFPGGLPIFVHFYQKKSRVCQWCQCPTSLHSEFQHVTGIRHVRRREKIRVPGFVEDFSQGIGCDTHIEPWAARLANIQKYE